MAFLHNIEVWVKKGNHMWQEQFQALLEKFFQCLTILHDSFILIPIVAGFIC
jgi:hypothetical protein